MNEELAGRVAVVTGASRGVGRSIAEALAAAGARVASFSRGPSSVGLHVPVDVSSPRDVLRAKDVVETELGSATVLVNAAGIYGPLQLIKDSDPTAWIEVLMVNTVGTYLTCRAFAQSMIDLGWGRIVNLTSAASLHLPGPLNSAYATSKVAVNQLTRHLAAELTGTGVTANVLHPGDLKTDIWSDIKNQIEPLGPLADPYREWISWVDQSGGDPVDKPAKAVLDIVAGSTNGLFHWVDNPLQEPLPSWP
jgi:NAD(P)-dependent dehydrogenase (short-subunit alcohol dehydrogenase family)